MFTDARVSRIFAGSSEIMKEIIGRAIGLDERPRAAGARPVPVVASDDAAPAATDHTRRVEST
jgi:hypothetical protein